MPEMDPQFQKLILRTYRVSAEGGGGRGGEA
jgi:hypothetical protein